MNASDLRSNTRTFWFLLTTNYNRHNRLFPNSIHANRSHHTADYMLLLQIWRRGIQSFIGVIYIASICLFLHGWLGWVLGGESVMSIPDIQACSAFRHDVAPVGSRFLPGNRTYKEVIRPSDKTKRPWKERRPGTIRRLLSAFTCGSFPNGRKRRPCYTMLFHLHPYCSRLRWQRFACNYVCCRKQ